MSKQETPKGLSWAKATDQLKAKVKMVLQMAQNNRYSVSRVYAAYNGVFELSEAPQTCSTCLTSRAARLRKWWAEHAPKEGDEVKPAATDEATTYDEVVAKYKISFDADSEAEVLQNFIQAGVSGEHVGFTKGITANELALIEARYSEYVGAAADAALIAIVDEKLGGLDITKDSSDEDTLAAYRMLADMEGNAPNEQAFYNAQILIHEAEQDEAAALKLIDDNAPDYSVINMGVDVLGMHFTPSAEDATKGTILNADGSKVKAGTYTAADGTVIAVQVGGKASIKQ